MSPMASQVPANERYEESRAISLMARDQYQREVSWMKAQCPLTVEEEHSLLLSLERAKHHPGDAHFASLARQARCRLVEGYQGLVLAMAWKYARAIPSMDVLDFVQEGSTGLFIALEKMEHPPESFLSFAAACIRNAIRRFLSQARSLVRLPADAMQVLPQLEEAVCSLCERKRMMPSVSELAVEMHTSNERIIDWLFWRECSHMSSLHDVLSASEEEGEDGSFPSVQVSALLGQGVEGRPHRDLCPLMKQVLSPYQYQVICLSYGLDGETSTPLSTGEIAYQLGTIESVIRKTRQRAMDRLRQAITVSVCDGVSYYALRPEYDAAAFYTVREVMDKLGVSKPTVLKYAHEGILPAERRKTGEAFAWRFVRQAVDAFASSSSCEADRSDLIA